jgi:hypothetical protein
MKQRERCKQYIYVAKKEAKRKRLTNFEVPLIAMVMCVVGLISMGMLLQGILWSN